MTEDDKPLPELTPEEHRAALLASIAEKMRDAWTPGAVIEFDWEEAMLLGAYEEQALSREDAWESRFDVLNSRA